MAIISHPQIGLMDLDTPVHKVRPGFNIGARNVIWRGTQGNRRPESNLGTTLIPNGFLPNTGTNVTIGVKYDENKQRLFFFNYNSAGQHGIYIYYTTVGTFVMLIQVGINTTGDPLAFLPYPRISSVDILYGDGQSGDLLVFVDSQLRPRKLNINRLLNRGYTGIKNNFLKVIKAPPIAAPQVTYENDYTVNVNSLQNSLWQFAYTLLYDDSEESVVSTASIVPLPPQQFDPKKNIPVSEGARIAAYFQTGDQNIKKIRLYGRQTTSGGTGGWQIIETLSKSDLSIPDNTVYKYIFYGNGNYPAADPSFTVLLFDYVPIQANAQCLLNGNTIAYGGITEGYDYVNPNISVASVNVNAPYDTVNSALFFGAANGIFTGSQPQFTFYLTGAGNNDGFGNPTTLEQYPELLFVRAKSNGSNIGFSIAVVTSNIADNITRLQTAAVTAGWTFVSSNTNSITLYYPTGTVTLDAAFPQQLITTSTPYNLDNFAHLPQAGYQYGGIYFDEDGRTNSTIANAKTQVTTPSVSDGQIPQVTITLSNPPPSWAAYWRPVRTDNLTYSKWLQWISGSAYSNSLATAAQQFGYFGISNIQDYNNTINSTQNVVSYQFNPGDRIRITGRYAANGSFTPLNLDYPILGVAVNPVTNGLTRTGSFVQISYPTADIKLDGTTDFQNYQIVLYAYKPQNPNGTNVFYEVGRTYGIGNQGQPSAYHMGNVNDNVVSITDGDVFYRTRQVPIDAIYNVPMGAFIQGSPYGTMWVNPGGGGTPIVDNGIYAIRGSVNKVAGLDNAHYPTFGDADYDILNESSGILTVRLQYTINVTDTTDPNGQFQAFVKVAAPGNIITVYPVTDLQTGLAVGKVNSYVIDATIPMPAGSKLWPVNFCQNQMSISPSPMKVTFTRNISLNVFDFSYSDIYNLRTNADNRPSIVDTTAKQTYFSALLRYSQADQLGTNVNNSNRFYPANFDEFTKQYGDIMRMIVWQKRVRIAQKRKWGEIAVYGKFIKNNSGEVSLVVSDTIITPNNIQYMEWDYGVGNQSDCIATNGYQIWFTDPVRGAFCRLSLDGIKVISEEAMVQTFSGSALTPYLNAYNYSFGGQSSILCAYNFSSDRDAEVIFSLQPGTSGGKTVGGQSISWNESKGGFQGFYDYAPDAIISCENTLYSFSNGRLYSHTNNSQYCNYYGTQFKPQLTYVFNDFGAEKKYWKAITQVANVPWNSPLIYTQTETYPGQRQESKLIDQNFSLLEGMQHASFLRDVKSQKGWINGDYLKGAYIAAQLQPTDGSKFVFLNDVSVLWSDSPLTAK